MMCIWGWLLCGILMAVILFLAAKLYIFKKSVREIDEGFRQRLLVDTNTLIDISGSDADLRHLAVDINTQLAQLREQRRRYLHGDRELKEAVVNISHDLRTPLTAVCGYLDLLEGEEKSETAERYLGFIKERTEVMKKLTEELFRYTVVLSSGEMQMETVNINSVLEESIAALYGALTRRGIEPEIQMTETPVVRQLNRGALARIFENILNNALKYSDGDLEIALNEDGEVTFSNTAKSLDEIQVARLFERYYTVETGRGSTGLGLSIARALTDQMGGHITAEYEEHKLKIKVMFSIKSPYFSCTIEKSDKK